MLKQKGFPGVFVGEFIKNTKNLVTKFKVYNTGSFQVALFLSTIPAQQPLLDVIRRERLYSLWLQRVGMGLSQKEFRKITEVHRVLTLFLAFFGYKA